MKRKGMVLGDGNANTGSNIERVASRIERFAWKYGIEGPFNSLQCDIYDKQEDLSIMHIVSWPCSLVLVSYSNTMLQFQPYLLLSIHCQSGSTPIHISCKVTIANVHQYNCWTSRITTRLQTYYMKTFNFWSHAWGLTSSDNNIIAYLLSKNCIYGNNLAIQQKNLLSLLPYPRS